MAKPKVFVTWTIPTPGLNKLAEHCDLEVWNEPSPAPDDLIKAKAVECDGLLTMLSNRIDAALIAAAPKLRVISNFAVGYNNIDVAAATARGISVGNTPDVLTEATADLAFALMIAAARRIIEGSEYAKSGKWKAWEPLGHIGQDLVGKTVGVVGLGRIGYAFAKRCRRGWDMNVLYCNRRPNEQAEKDLQARRVSFDELLAESDFVVILTDLNPSTKGMFNAAAFAKMKRTAVFVNATRGGVMVQKDLVEALQNRTIFAAGLDVTDPEPPSADDPLLSLPNLALVPHIGSATVSTRNGMSEIAADNVLLGLQGKRLRCGVNMAELGR